MRACSTGSAMCEGVITYLSLEDLLDAADAALGHPAQVRDYGLLESAVMRPATSVFGEDAYPGIHEKAAALLHSVVRNHPLIDGNKRLGWVATRLFYVLNELDLRAAEDDAFEFVMSVAAGQTVDVPEMARWLGARVAPAP